MFKNSHYDVIVAGAGPIGLMLAAELGLAGVHVAVIERRAELDTAVKAEGINAASAAAFDRRGLLPELEAVTRQLFPVNITSDGARRPKFVGHFGGIQVPSDPVDEHNPTLRDRGPAGWRLMQIPQIDVERILGRHADERGVEVVRGVELREITTDDDGVTVTTDIAGDVRAAWLVGCDGGRSLVRRLAGFDFVGTDPEIVGRQTVATVHGAEALGQGWQHTPNGLYVYGPMPGRLRTVEFDSTPMDRDSPVTADELEASVRRVSGVDVRITDIVSAAHFTDNARQATSYRRERVLLCGDAAHVHSPFSGQGLNLGIGDAVNLGWKLAGVVHGWAPDDLLDTYSEERHPIGERVLDWTRSQVAVMRGDAASHALRGVVADFLDTRDGATYYVTQTSGLGQRYELGDDAHHPLVGTTMPDIDLGDGTRLADHAHDGKALLVDLTSDHRHTERLAGYHDRLRVVCGPAHDTAPPMMLVRPDGFVAWVCDESPCNVAALDSALARWLGQPVGDIVTAGRGIRS